MKLRRGFLNVKAKKEGYWTLALKGEEEKKLREDLEKTDLLFRFDSTPSDEGHISVVKLYMDGSDYKKQKELFSYLQNKGYLQKMYKKRYPNMLFTFITKKGTYPLSNLMDLYTGDFYEEGKRNESK